MYYSTEDDLYNTVQKKNKNNKDNNTTPQLQDFVSALKSHKLLHDKHKLSLKRAALDTRTQRRKQPIRVTGGGGFYEY